MDYYNNHSHIFTMNNAPQRFLHLFVPDWLADFIDKATNTKLGASIFETVLRVFPGKQGKRYAMFLKIGKSKNQLEVFEDLMGQYKDDPQMRFVALAMYMELTGAGPSQSGYEGQIEEILRVRQHYPERLLIFLGIDPRWKQNGDDLQKTVERYFSTPLPVNGAGKTVSPFCGLKLYPCTGFYPFDERLKPTFEWAAENKVPILTHCNYEGGIFYNDASYIKANLRQFNPYDLDGNGNPTEYPSQGKAPQYTGKNKASNNMDNCSYFMEPNSFRSLLTYFERKNKPLKICFAHYGSSQHILFENNKRKIDEQKLFGVLKQNWCGQIRSLINDFSEVYTDISFALSDKETHSCFFEDLANENMPRLQERIMYGTDFFLTEQVMAESDDYSRFKGEALKITLANGNTCWDQMASVNTQNFLKSRFYP